MYQLFRTLEKEKFLIAYLGVFTDEITTMLIELSNHLLVKENTFSKKSKRVSFLITECFQNVIRYGNIDKLKDAGIDNFQEFFQVALEEDRVIISSSNLIEKTLVQKLDEKIQLINSLDKSALKELHTKVHLDGKFSSRGGASLGLIDMVRKSGLPIDRSFINYNNVYDQLFIGLEMTGFEEKTKKSNIKKVENRYKELVDKNVLMTFKGDFSNDSSIVLIEMLENNFCQQKKNTSGKTKRLFSVIEIIQNISKHGKKVNGYKEGIFVISKVDNELFIEAGNYIEKQNYQKFKKYLDDVSILDQKQINDKYLHRLANPKISNGSYSGLGILEILRNNKKNVKYSFTKTEKNEIFYSIKVKLS